MFALAITWSTWSSSTLTTLLLVQIFFPQISSLWRIASWFFSSFPIWRPLAITMTFSFFSSSCSCSFHTTPGSRQWGRSCTLVHAFVYSHARLLRHLILPAQWGQGQARTGQDRFLYNRPGQVQTSTLQNWLCFRTGTTFLSADFLLYALRPAHSSVRFARQLLSHWRLLLLLLLLQATVYFTLVLVQDYGAGLAHSSVSSFTFMLGWYSIFSFL